MSVNARLTYTELLTEAEALICECMESFAREPDEIRQTMHRGFANGAFLLWAAAASRMTAKIDDAEIAAYHADRARLEALIDAVPESTHLNATSS